MWPHVSAPPGMVAAVAGAARALLPEMVMPRLPKDA